MNSGGRSVWLILMMVFAAGASQGQGSRELFSEGMSGSPIGPTIREQTVRMSVNGDNPSASTISAANTQITVTARLSNQQYKGIGTGEGSPVVVFGAAKNARSASPIGLPVFGSLASVATARDLHYSSVPDGRSIGIDTSANYGLRLFTSVRQFAEAESIPTDQRLYMADLTLDFSSPISDPFIHVAGFGGRIGALTFATELEPVTPGVSLARVSGNAAFDVSPTVVGTIISPLTNESCDALAACGTVKLVGKNLTSVRFRVYIRGNGGTQDWGSSADHNGDEWMLSVSLPKVLPLAGSVFYDADGPATLDGWEIGSASGRALFVNLIDPTDMGVIGTSPVDDQGGYLFSGVPGEGTDHILELSTEAGNSLFPAPKRSLPSGWSNVGEQLRLDVKPGNDGTPDGRLAVTVTDFYHSNALFAVRMEPGPLADIIGRVTTHDGRSSFKAEVELSDPVSGETYRTLTNQFGYYRFLAVPAGRIYKLSALDRKRGLSQSTDQLLLQNLAGIDLVLYPAAPASRNAVTFERAAASK